MSDEIDSTSLEFEDVMAMLLELTREILLSADELARLHIPGDLSGSFRQLVTEGENFLATCATADQTEEARVRAWSLHDRLPQASDARKLAEVIVLCTYDRESAEFDTFGAEPMIDSILTSLGSLNPDYCRSFKDYLERKRAV